MFKQIINFLTLNEEMAESLTYQHRSRTNKSQAPRSQIPFEESFRWLVVKNVNLQLLSDLEAIMLLRKFGRIHNIEHLKDLGKEFPKTILARYQSADMKNIAKFNINGQRVGKCFWNALDHKTSDAAERVNRQSRFDPKPYEGEKSAVISGLSMPSHERFPLAEISECIATHVDKNERFDPKLLINVKNIKMELRGRTAYTVFVQFTTFVMQDNSLRILSLRDKKNILKRN